MKIPVRVRAFPGTDQERLDMLAAVRHHCMCKSVEVGASIAVIDDPCPPHDLLDEATLKQLVFQRRWYRRK